MAGEWTKLAGERSTPFLLALGVVLTVGLSALTCWFTARDWTDLDAAAQARFDPVTFSLEGVPYGVLAFAVLGVLAVSREYGSGTIRTTISVVPRRLPVLYAKLLVVAGLTAAVALPATLVSLVLSQRVLDAATPTSVPRGLGADVLASGVAPQALRVIAGGTLYLVGVAVTGVLVAFLLRSTAGALCAVIGVYYVLTPIVGLFPHSVADAVQKWLPSRAGIQLAVDLPQGLAPWAGFGVYCTYLALLGALAASRLRTTDV